MEQTEFIWHNNKFVKWEDANIHMLSHSLHYGSAAFEGIRFYDTSHGIAIFRLEEHIHRLIKSAKSIFLDIPYKDTEIKDAIIETVKKNKIKAGYIRPIVFHGYGKMGLIPTGAELNVAIAVWPWGAYLGEKPIKVKTSSFIRHHPKTGHSESKISGNYVNSILAGMEVKSQGYDEALLLDYQNNIAEGPGENFFIIKNNALYTPPLGNILPGITRHSIMQIAEDKKMKVVVKHLSLKDAYSADEAFFTGTAAEVTPIASIDDNPMRYAFGPITRELKDMYLNACLGKT